MFSIHRVLWKPVYILRDLQGEVIDGIFDEQQLTHFKDLREGKFIIDRVLKERNNKTELLVSWRGYSSEFDSWIPASSLISK